MARKAEICVQASSDSVVSNFVKIKISGDGATMWVEFLNRNIKIFFRNLLKSFNFRENNLR